MQSYKDSQVQSNKGYHRLFVWQKAKALLLLIYKTTNKFPSEEMYCLTSQIRRAMLSVILNIVEGHRRKSKKEFMRFLDTADASLTEVEACLEIAFDLNYISQKEHIDLETKRKEIAVMLSALMKSIQKTL